MDNVTHTLIGIAAAESLLVTGKREKWRVPLWIASGAANNLPDLDVFFSAFRHADKLDYLLQHRGYTHTLLLAPLQSIALLAALRLAWRKRTDLPWREITCLLFAGPLLHVFADSWNSYGVHPFWPFDNSWYYGDLIFIVEPWLWVLLLPLVWRRCRTKYGKAICLALLGFLTVTCWRHPFVTWPIALALSLTVVAALLAQYFTVSLLQRLGGTLAAIALVFGIFGSANSALRKRFSPEGSELALLSHPGNPFCWTILAAGFTGENYRAAAWTASPWPEVSSPASCPRQIQSDSTAQLKPISEVPSAGPDSSG